jgi:hypothetical protein
VTWIKSQGLKVSYYVLRGCLRQMVRVQYFLRDVVPGLRFSWVRKSGYLLLSEIVTPLKLSLAGTLENILIAQRRIP